MTGFISWVKERTQGAVVIETKDDYTRVPDTIALLSLAAIAGLVQFTGSEYPRSVVELVGPTWAALWAVSLALSSATALAGVLWNDFVYGWMLELAGRIGLAATALAYTVVIFTEASTLLLAFTAALAVSASWRIWQLSASLRRWFRHRKAVDQ